MTSDVPFERLLIGCSFFVGLVVAFDLLVLVGYFETDEARVAALIGAALALVAVITIVALLVAGRRSLRRTRRGRRRRVIPQRRANAFAQALAICYRLGEASTAQISSTICGTWRRRYEDCLKTLVRSERGGAAWGGSSSGR